MIDNTAVELDLPHVVVTEEERQESLDTEVKSKATDKEATPQVKELYLTEDIAEIKLKLKQNSTVDYEDELIEALAVGQATTHKEVNATLHAQQELFTRRLAQQDRMAQEKLEADKRVAFFKAFSKEVPNVTLQQLTAYTRNNEFMERVSKAGQYGDLAEAFNEGDGKRVGRIVKEVFTKKKEEATQDAEVGGATKNNSFYSNKSTTSFEVAQQKVKSQASQAGKTKLNSDDYKDAIIKAMFSGKT
jgi:hypothetical protein